MSAVPGGWFANMRMCHKPMLAENRARTAPDARFRCTYMIDDCHGGKWQCIRRHAVGANRCWQHGGPTLSGAGKHP